MPYNTGGGGGVLLYVLISRVIIRCKTVLRIVHFRLRFDYFLCDSFN